MPRRYDKDFKSMIVNLICVEKHSTIKTAEQFGIPLKTVEKWITAYNKDHRVFDSDYKSQSQIIDDLKRKVASLENAGLSKVIEEGETQSKGVIRRARDLLMRAPSKVSEQQLEDVHIKLAVKEEK